MNQVQRAEEGDEPRLLLEWLPVFGHEDRRNGMPLLPVRRRQLELGHEGDSSRISWLTVLGLLFLTFNSGIAVLRSGDDYTTIALVVFAYMDLILLFYHLRWFERGPPKSRLKMAIWALTTALTVLFSYKVATVMPLPAAVLVWVMAGAAVVGFYAFFNHHEEVVILARSRTSLPV